MRTRASCRLITRFPALVVLTVLLLSPILTTAQSDEPQYRPPLHTPTPGVHPRAVAVADAGPLAPDTERVLRADPGGVRDVPGVDRHGSGYPSRSVVPVPTPRLIVVIVPSHDDGASQAVRGTASGTASWFDDGPGLYAAVHSYRWGQPRYSVRVCSGSRCVTATVRDYCQCYVGTSRERLIDLSPAAFARLGSLSRGILPVTVEGMR